MIICAHRINTVAELERIPHNFGVEVDIRSDGKDLILHHDPHRGGESLREYLKHYRHAFIILDIKEAGIEDEVIALVEHAGITDYFLLDVEYPYIYRATHTSGTRKIAVRYSEAEPIEFALAHKGLVDWVWIDTNTRLPLDTSIARSLVGFKLALVSPDRWGRPEDIPRYRALLESAGITVNLVMVEASLAYRWRE